MTLPALAPVSALEVRLGFDVGSLTGADLGRATAALEDVSALVREEAGLTWVATDLVTITAPASALAVVYAAAIRIFLNPEGLVSESVGSGAYASARGQDGLSRLTAEERAVIRAAAKSSAGSSTGVYSVGTPSPYGG